MKRSVTVLVSLEELWLLQGVIRHEIAQRDQWKFPPADRDLNDKIAEAIVFCTDNEQPEAALDLCHGDLYAIDYCVQAAAKNAAGQALGKTLLLKSFRARRLLEDDPPLAAGTVEEPLVDIIAKLAELAAQPKTRRRKSQ